MGILDLPLGNIPQVVDPTLIQHARDVDDAILLEGAQVLRCDSREMLGSLALLDYNWECDVGVLLPVLERERDFNVRGMDGWTRPGGGAGFRWNGGD